ncbi:MAG: type II/IV secretion system protein [Gammaproteobacteria bacterium]|nr:type II/IV secretion system protein [Gammaproteobacteria bacterium]
MASSLGSADGDTRGEQHDRILDLRSVLDDLVADGRLDKGQADRLAGQPRRRDQLQFHLLELIAQEEFEDRSQPGKRLDLEALTLWLCEKSGQPYHRIDPLKVNVERVTGVMSYQFAQRHNILAVELTEEEVVIATSQPWVRSWEPMLEQTLGTRRIRRVITNPADLRRFTVEFYTMARSVRRARDQHQSGAGAAITNLEQMLDIGRLKSPEANDAHIVNIVDWLLQYAFDQRASDIHIEPRREQGRVRFRIDGVLHDIYALPAPVMTAVVSRLKILGRMDVAEKRRPQDGRIKTRSSENAEVELRLSTMPTAFGEKMVMRIFDPDVLLRSFEDLGFGGEDLKRWYGMVHNPHGIVLVTGPTGSGKTTTLYSTLKDLATPEVNVCTIEDPIEMVESSFNQMQVQKNIELDFASGVRALLRQDPDIIMIGEIRDLETAEMAIQAALTGHLVLSTLHTNDAPSAITRLLELEVPAYLIRATVLGCMAQRLIRVLCPHCKAQAPVDEDAWRALIRPFKVPLPEHAQRAVGCIECRDTGFMGRVGIYELLPVTDRVKPLIAPQCDLTEIRTQAMREGMRTLRLSGALQVARGNTTIEEVLRVVPLTSGD